MHAVPAAQVVDILVKLIIAVLMGGAVGWQREARDRPAGLRTHMLVCMGAAVYTLTMLGFGEKADPARVAAQVATGMGFLGAGTIIRHGNEVRGLTTAASLWAVAAIGICIALGGITYWVALFGTGLVLLTLTVVRQVEMRLLSRPRFFSLTVRLSGGAERVPELQRFLTEKGVQVTSMDITSISDGGEEIHVGVRLPPGVDQSQLICELSALPGFQALKCD